MNTVDPSTAAARRSASYHAGGPHISASRTSDAEIAVDIPAHAVEGATATAERKDLLAAIARGEYITAEVHTSLTGEPAVLEVDHFNLWYGAKQALFDISMNVPHGKVTAMIGPSGCGKSTLLRCVNRMNDLIDTVRIGGDMRLNNDSIYGPGVDVIELRKRMGMVFQKPNPFPMSIYENVIYPLRIDGIRDRRVLDEVCEHSLRGAALWEEVKDRLKDSALPSRAVSNNVCALPARSPASRKCCYLMSPARRSIRLRPARSKI